LLNQLVKKWLVTKEEFVSNLLLHIIVEPVVVVFATLLYAIQIAVTAHDL